MSSKTTSSGDVIAAALADESDPDRLAVAAHEVGHGIAWHAAGIKIDRMVLETGVFGGLTGAYCRRADGFWLDADNVADFLVGLAAGGVAQARFLTTHRGYSRGSARAKVRSGCSADDDELRRLSQRYDSLSLDVAWRRAGDLLARHDDRLDRLTVELTRKGRLSGRAL